MALSGLTITSLDEYLRTFTDKINNVYLNKSPFDFKSVPYSQYLRFIEIVPTDKLFTFMRTSKSNYKTCLNLRGLECSKVGLHAGYHERCCFDSKGILFPYELVPDEWKPFLVPRDEFRVYSPTLLKMDIVQKYKSLVLWDKEGFPDIFNQYVSRLVHIHLESASIVIPYDSHYPLHHCPFTPEQVATFFNNFNICGKLHTLHFSHYKFRETGNLSVAAWKTSVEALCQQNSRLINVELLMKKRFVVRYRILKFKNLVENTLEDFNPETILM